MCEMDSPLFLVDRVVSKVFRTTWRLSFHDAGLKRPMWRSSQRASVRCRTLAANTQLPDRVGTRGAKPQSGPCARHCAPEPVRPRYPASGNDARSTLTGRIIQLLAALKRTRPQPAIFHPVAGETRFALCVPLSQGRTSRVTLRWVTQGTGVGGRRERCSILLLGPRSRGRATAVH
jgi:hypothetical protein